MSKNFSYDQLYPNLFSPMTVGKTEFKNRIFVAPTHTSFSAGLNNLFTPEGMKHFGNFAKGGAGLVHIGETLLDRKTSAAHDSHLNMIDEETLKRFNTYNQYCHIFRAKTSIEFNHSGHFASPEVGDGSAPMTATARKMPSGVEAREMNEDDMEYVAHIYAKAANMAKRAGFDMALLHFGHGWLMGGFLSPILNQRKDKYGGNVENRMRFPRMVAERVRKAVGKDFLLEVRLTGDDCHPGGIVIEDTIENVKMLEDIVDLAHISVGNRFIPISRAIMHPTHFIEEGHNVPLAAIVKKAGVKIPIGTLGGINTPEFAEKCLAEGFADYVLMARSWIADPNWANKARQGKSEDITPCIRCMRCLDIPLGKRNTSTHNLSDIHDEFPQTTRRSNCSVNVFHGNGQCRSDFPPAEKSKKVVVVGGGIAGMNAAINACNRGHEVILMEKDDSLGGQIHYAKHVWFKTDMERYRQYLELQVKKLNIQLLLGCEATPQSIESYMPDAVIVAVGAEPIIPNIPGVDNDNVYHCLDFFGDEEKLGKNVVIIGAGMVGCESALHLSSKGISSTLIEMADVLAPDGVYTERLHTVDFIEKDPLITSRTQTKCVKIEKNAVIVESANSKQEAIQADSVILAVGMRSLASIRDSFKGCAFDVICVGDCEKVGTVSAATATGYDAALCL